MTKHVVEFTIPDDQYDLETFMNGPKLEGLIHRIEQEVFRPARKHGYGNWNLGKVVEQLDKLVDIAAANPNLAEFVPKDENEQPLGATHLIGMLEELYYDIKDEELNQ